MKEKFCPKCGKKTERFYEGLCEACYLSKFSLSKKLPDKIIIRQCKFCGKFFLGNHSGSVENLIEAFLQEILKKGELTSVSYRMVENKLYLTLSFKVNDLEKTEEKEVDMVVKKIICQACAMKESGYFQAIIQVRAPANLLSEIKKEIEEQIDYLNQYDNLAFISSFQEVKNGFDVFIGSKASAQQIARTIKLKYKAKIKITRKIAGKLKGKKVYRDTILIFIP
jgi:NMD protein affecting ribosome stability and mRNA decay